MSILPCRYARNATFQLAILPGKCKADFESFLSPIVEELLLLGKKTLVVQAGTASSVRCKVYALFINGDGVEINRLLRYSGHTQ